MDLHTYLKKVWADLADRKDVGVDALAGCLSTTSRDLLAVPRRYSRTTIPKRSGRARTLHVPAPELKRVQGMILRRLLERIPCHPHATGFHRGRSIVTNANFHAGSAIIVNIDIRDFFLATRASRVRQFFARLGWAEDAAALLTRLCTHEGGLPQGAPTSPCLSNLVNHRLDRRLVGLATRHGAVYSRYADDITFSLKTRNRVAALDMIKASARILIRHGYELQETKTRIVTRSRRQMVTGLVVNDRPRLPREKRRLLRAAEHRLRVGKPITLTTDQLDGWQSLVKMIESQSKRI